MKELGSWYAYKVSVLLLDSARFAHMFWLSPRDRETNLALDSLAPKYFPNHTFDSTRLFPSDKMLGGVAVKRSSHLAASMRSSYSVHVESLASLLSKVLAVLPTCASTSISCGKSINKEHNAFYTMST